jgi:DNA-binding LacI/PurR family transcriptional regulator
VIKINEVAHLARVAPSSVSRVLNDHPDVSDEMNVLEHHRHQVLVAPRALGRHQAGET